MYQTHEMEAIRFKDNNVWTDVEGPTMSVEEEEELGWPDDG